MTDWYWQQQHTMQESSHAWKYFLHHLKAKNYQKRKVAFMENGSWAPMAAKIMKGIVEGFKNIEMVDPVVTIKSTMNDENIKTMEELADNLL